MKPKFKAYKEVVEPGKAQITIKEFPAPLTNEKLDFVVPIPEDAEPWVSYTATTGMRECIGNMVTKDTARGYIPGDPQHVFRVRNPFGLKKGARCYITEHLRLDGEPEYLVTQHRIHQGDDNFVSIGYTTGGEPVIVLKLDVITGESKWA
jgi:hypothetical protein